VPTPNVIYQPKPEYPALAQESHVEGTVRLRAVIGTDGRIRNLKVVRGHPALVRAALPAIARWHYKPTVLAGEPVEVETEIDVSFRLHE
jgi:protein TonB